MKTLTPLILFSLLLSSCKDASTQVDAPIQASKPKADTVQKPQAVVQYDSVEAKDVWVQNKPIINTKVNKWLTIIKTADSVTQGRIEEFDYGYTEYNIKGTVLRFHDTVFAGLTMNDNTLAFSIAGHRVKIGDDQNYIKAMFPKAFAERDTTSYSKKGETIVYVSVKDASIELHFFLNKQGTVIGIEIMTVLDA